MFGKKPPSGDMNPFLHEPPPQTEPYSNVPSVIEETLPRSTSQNDVAEKIVSDQQQTVQGAEDEILSYSDANLETDAFMRGSITLLEMLLEKIDLPALMQLETSSRRTRVEEAARDLVSQIQVPLNNAQIDLLITRSIDEVLGYGPLEVLLEDHDVSDIMINGHNQIYVEKNGKIKRTDVRFMDESHLLGIVQRIVGRVGRRVDEANPMVDARMPDGSRFNAIIPPLALDGSLVSIRKFKKSKMPLSSYIQYNSLNEQMYKFLEICGRCRLNVMISGGTGSGKTTLLNAMSGHIGSGERVITIEDAAELQLQQPHVLRLETRPASMEGKGEITQRQLVKNALRMRPDRIILGEIRGDEIIDLLSAMNTGHDGSMSTIHANNPRDCLARIENLVGMSGIEIPMSSLRPQIASAINLIVQISRMRDGKRRITHIEEVVGIEGNMISMQTLFKFNLRGVDENNNIIGNFEFTGLRPRMLERAAYFGLDNEVMKLLNMGGGIA